MRILSIGNFGTGWDGSICDEEHIAGALEELGHEVIRHQREETLDTLPLFWKGLDFALIAQWDGYSEEFIGRLKQLVPKAVYWAFDYQADGQEWHERLVKGSDLYLSKRLADAKYKNWRWFSQDFAPQFLQPAPEVEKDIDILFTGSYLPWAKERNQILKLIDENYNLTICSVNGPEFESRGFKDVRGPVMDDALPAMIARAKINLSVDHTIEAGYWSDRNSQIIACGGFVLCRYVPMMESVFRSHITYFFGLDDVLSAVDYWLDRDEDRGMIAGQAYEYSPMYKVKEKAADLLNIVRDIL